MVHRWDGWAMTSRREFLAARDGEEAAWVCHSRMFAGEAVRAMTTETRGQSSAFIWHCDDGNFPPQKALLLPERCSRVPVKWLV